MSAIAGDDEADIATPPPQLGWAAKLTPSPSRLPLPGQVLIRTSIQRIIIVADLVSVVYAILSPGGVAASRQGALVAIGLLACSIVVWTIVTVTGRRLLVYRLAAAIAGTAVLASLASPGHEAMVMLGAAAVVEVSMVRGPWAVLVPIAWFVTSAASGLGAPMYGAAVVAVFNWLLGWGMAIYLMLRERTQRREMTLLTAARSDEARLAAHSDVLCRSGGTADLIQRAGVLLALQGSHVGQDVAATKRVAAAGAHQRGGLLGTEVARWASTVNSSPDLGGRVQPEMAPDVATLLLTETQVDAVRARLGTLAARGRIDVRLVAGATERTDRDRTIAVGNDLVVVPGSPGLRRWVISPVPTACVLVVVWMLHPLAAGLTTQPIVPVGFFLIGLVLARWAYRAVERDAASVTRIVVVFCVFAAAFSAACAPSAVPVIDNPAVRMAPAEGASEIAILLLAFSRPYVSASVVRLFPLVALTLVVLNAASLMGSSWRNVVAESVFVPGMWLAARNWGEYFERADGTLRERREALLERVVSAGAAAGRSEVIAQLRAGLAQLRDERRVFGPELDAELVAEIDRRIDLAERSLVEFG